VDGRVDGQVDMAGASSEVVDGQADRPACISQTSTSARRGGGQSLTAGRGEADGVTLGEGAGPLELDVAAGDEQVQVRGVGQGGRAARLQA
jgi:hypothetical protein